MLDDALVARPRTAWLLLGLILLAVSLVHLLASPYGEPFKNNDETRHVMTGVFVHDALHDWRSFFPNPRAYTINYYTQYPALGLLVWPPLFYLIEGVAMLVLGPSYATGRMVLSGFVVLAAVYAFQLVRLRFSPRVAVATVGLLLLSPLVFDLSRFCLLEIPTLAFVLGSIYHFEAYLGSTRWRDAWLACLFAAAASLTRFDGIVLAPYFLLRLLVTNSWARLLDRAVLGGLVVALLLTVPYYLLTWQEYRTGLTTAAIQGTSGESTRFLAIDNLYLYLSFIPGMLGYGISILSLYGMIRGVKDRQPATGFAWCLIVATYFTFVPLAEPEARHAIYWVPGWCFFAAIGLRVVYRQGGAWLAASVVVLIVGGTLWESVAGRGPYLRGYAEAARYCLTHQSTNRPWFTDGTLTGGFVFQVRQVDPARRVHVLRGDKLLYAVMSDQVARYEEFAKSDAEILQIIHDHDPEFLVIENPSLIQDTPASIRLRSVLRDHPDRFKMESIIAFDTNHYLYVGKQLEIWRKLDRNSNPRTAVSIPVLGLGRNLDGSRR